ncbi:hypothetical protein MG293_010559 [Ovis ammon polii]|uniref:MHC class I-like antigen recognition-like domain-containing protein n=1 Tax=Ovis ammon polii TaxID=230172 RepID=A0AAD4U6G8_OVIAM|nr:hypothetical protein MG293_010559 [Ovis ammon polii]
MIGTSTPEFSQGTDERDGSKTTVIGEKNLSIHLALNLTPWLSRSGLRTDGEIIGKRVSMCEGKHSEDSHSLSYNFTIDPRPRDNQLWCEVQGEVDQKVFLSYDCGTAQIKYMSPLGEEVKNMSAWEAQTVTLRDTGDLLQGQMPGGTPENHTDKVRSGPLTLQARMTCWHEDNGHTSASWEFGFNGQLCLLFDSENGHCTVVHPGGRWMKEKWENDRAVTDFFRMVSMGDCPAWLQAFLVHWEKMLKTSDAHCLCYNFPVDPHPSPGELWCVIQGQVDGNVYLYDCAGTMIQSTSPLGEEVKTTNTWETQRETLRDIGDFLKGQLPDIIPEKHAPRAPPAMGPSTVQPMATAVKSKSRILPMLLTSFIITDFLG